MSNEHGGVGQERDVNCKGNRYFTLHFTLTGSHLCSNQYGKMDSKEAFQSNNLDFENYKILSFFDSSVSSHLLLPADSRTLGWPREEKWSFPVKGEAKEQNKVQAR